MEKILEQMFKGVIAHEASWDGEKYTRTIEDCTIEACDGDLNTGLMLVYFNHWSNDIQSLAPHFGIMLDRLNGKLVIRKDMPKAPSPQHWWYEGEWHEPGRNNSGVVGAIDHEVDFQYHRIGRD